MEINEPKYRIKVKNWERLGESENRSGKISKLLIYIEGLTDAFLTHNKKLAKMTPSIGNFDHSESYWKCKSAKRQLHFLEVRETMRKRLTRFWPQDELTGKVEPQARNFKENLGRKFCCCLGPITAKLGAIRNRIEENW